MYVSPRTPESSKICYSLPFDGGGSLPSPTRGGGSFAKGLLCVGIISFVAGCAIEPPKREGGPLVSERRSCFTPLSRYGNPQYYEVFGKRYYPLRSSRGFVETGLASWYGPGYHGRRTSNGEVYNMYQLTAAHKLLPLPTYAEVYNLQNGRKAVVKINDRGPFYKNRIIDLSYGAARKLGIVTSGTSLVQVRALDHCAPRLPSAGR